VSRAWLSIEGISRRYGDRPVFRDVWFGVERGELVALIGHSGCGKTTILSILARLEAPDGGTILEFLVTRSRTLAGARPGGWDGRHVPEVRPAASIIEETIS